MKYYVATRLENYEAHNQVRDLLNDLGHELTYDWSQHGPVWQAGIPRMREVCLLELGAIRAADFVVGLLPGGRGTHVELGYALALSKPVFLHSTRGEEHFTSHPESCAFYHHPLVTVLPADLRVAVAKINRAMRVLNA